MKKVLPFCLLTLLTAVLPASAQEPEYLKHYDPHKGFKPSQANLTEIFLQIAGSLEFHGSPEAYLRHMQQEHARVSRLFEQKIGKAHTSRMPSHMTEAYVDRLVKNWNTLSPPLGLEAFAKEIGRCTREGIMGTRLSGTLAVQIFNQHQSQVAGRMSGNSTQAAGFDELKARIARDLEFGKDDIDMAGYEVTRRDAVRYAYVIDGKFRGLSKKIDATIKPEKTALIKEAVAGMFIDLGYMAQSELEIGILQSGLDQMQSSTQ